MTNRRRPAGSSEDLLRQLHCAQVQVALAQQAAEGVTVDRAQSQMGASRDTSLIGTPAHRPQPADSSPAGQPGPML